MPLQTQSMSRSIHLMSMAWHSFGKKDFSSARKSSFDDVLENIHVLWFFWLNFPSNVISRAFDIEWPLFRHTIF
jgi:hypothetical protein